MEECVIEYEAFDFRYIALIGITILVASILEVGQAFHESRTPVAS